MSTPPLPIQFLLKQLEKEENRERFNTNNFKLECQKIANKVYFRHCPTDTIFRDDFDRFSLFIQIQIIRICLSRTKKGEAVLGVFEGHHMLIVPITEILCNKTFDWLLYNGNPLTKPSPPSTTKCLSLCLSIRNFVKILLKNQL